MDKKADKWLPYNVLRHVVICQKGSVVTVLMGGVALLAALTFTAYQFISGPLSTTAKVTQNNQVKFQQAMIAKSIMMDVPNLAEDGDCDLDGYIEPRIWRDAAGKPAPTNGGLVPMEIGVMTLDPWGLDYGYCAWDVGGNVPLSGETEYYFVAITTDNNSCAFKSDNTLWCWGTEGYGELGDGGSETDSTSVPLQSDSSTWTMIGRAYGQSYCGIKTDGSAWCWGKGNTGALGNNALSHSASPVEVFGGDSWQHITSGNGFSCGIKTDGSGWCWGAGRVRGDGTTGPGYEPTPQALDDGGATWKKIIAGSANACGIRNDDEIYCWGNNSVGRNGNGTDSGYQYSPGIINEAGPWIDISVGGQSACAIKADGSAWCWGKGQSGSLGDGVGGDHEEWDPIPIDDPDDWKSINIGSGTGCGVKTDDTGWCWGQNANGVVGDGTGSNRLRPVEIDGSYSWKYITPAQTHACGIQADNTVWCWGRETGGQLGNGSSSSTEQQSPVQITSFTTPGGGCPETRLDGADDPATGAEHTQTVMAVVSAGPDRAFSTTCNDYVDTTTNLIDSSGDDIVHRYAYSNAATAVPFLWQLKSGDDTTARIEKDLLIGDDIEFDIGNGLITASIFNSTGKTISGGGIKVGNESTVSCILAVDAGKIRFHQADAKLQVCTGTGGWSDLGDDGSTFPLRGPDGSISAPTYSFDNATAAGLYFNSNDIYVRAPSGQNIEFGIPSGTYMDVRNDLFEINSNGNIDFETQLADFITFENNDSELMVEVQGGIQFGDTTLTCDGAADGMIKFIESTNSYEYCDGSSWQQMAGEASGGGGSATGAVTLEYNASASGDAYFPSGSMYEMLFGASGSFTGTFLTGHDSNMQGMLEMGGFFSVVIMGDAESDALAYSGIEIDGVQYPWSTPPTYDGSQFTNLEVEIDPTNLPTGVALDIQLY